MKYLQVQDLVLFHDLVIEATGGSHGLRSLPALEAAAQLKPASIMHSLIKNHPFVDGNKRTAILATMGMLELNGLKFEASQAETIVFTLQVTKEKISLEKIANWLKENSRKLKT